jgi:hypothetical protein
MSGAVSVASHQPSYYTQQGTTMTVVCVMCQVSAAQKDTQCGVSVSHSPNTRKPETRDPAVCQAGGVSAVSHHTTTLGDRRPLVAAAKLYTRRHGDARGMNFFQSTSLSAHLPSRINSSLECSSTTNLSVKYQHLVQTIKLHDLHSTIISSSFWALSIIHHTLLGSSLALL